MGGSIDHRASVPQGGATSYLILPLQFFLTPDTRVQVHLACPDRDCRRDSEI